MPFLIGDVVTLFIIIVYIDLHNLDTRDIAKCPICRSDMVAPDHTTNHEERNLFTNRNETTYTTNTPNLTNILNRYGSLTNYINNYNITNDTQRQENYVSRSTLHREYTPMLPSITRHVSTISLNQFNININVLPIGENENIDINIFDEIKSNCPLLEYPTSQNVENNNYLSISLKSEWGENIKVVIDDDC